MCCIVNIYVYKYRQSEQEAKEVDCKYISKSVIEYDNLMKFVVF